MKGGRPFSPGDGAGDQPRRDRPPPPYRPPGTPPPEPRYERRGPPPWAQKKAGFRSRPSDRPEGPEHRGPPRPWEQKRPPGGKPPFPPTRPFPREGGRRREEGQGEFEPPRRDDQRGGFPRPDDARRDFPRQSPPDRGPRSFDPRREGGSWDERRKLPREPRSVQPRRDLSGPRRDDENRRGGSDSSLPSNHDFSPPRRHDGKGHGPSPRPFRDARDFPHGLRRDEERGGSPRGPRPFPPRQDGPPRSFQPHAPRPPRAVAPRDERPLGEARPPRPSGPANPRRVALEVLSDWEDSGTYADALLAGVDETTPFANPSDRALLQALVLGVLRHKAMLDIWIAELNQRGRLTPPVRWILRLGLFQLLKMGLAEHAAVDESVRLTFEEKPLVNAILRRAIEEKEHLLAIEGDAAAWEKFSLPDFLIERWRWLFGEEGMLKLAHLMSQPSEMFVRLNRLKPWPAVPEGAEPVEGVPDFFKVTSLPRAELEAGQCYVQDPATWFAVSMLDVRPGMTVLDACAAPGGKAALLAQYMENQGVLVATDSSPRRIRRLAANLTRLGVTCADCRAVDWKAGVPVDDGRRYDRILLDVPCSNTGVMRRRVDVRWRVTPAVVAEMADVQARILRGTIPFLAPGGKLSYSTCSLEPAENDQQVERVLAEFPQLTLLEKKLITPHETGFDGAFIAIFEAK